MTIRRIERQATQEELVENERRKKAFEAELLVERRVNINLKNKWRESGARVSSLEYQVDAMDRAGETIIEYPECTISFKNNQMIVTRDDTQEEVETRVVSSAEKSEWEQLGKG